MEQDVVETTGNVASEVEPKLLTQEHVNALVAKRTAAIAEKVKREMELAHKAEIAALQSQQQTSSGSVEPTMPNDEIYQKIVERLRADAQKNQEAQAEEAKMAQLNQMADNYFAKMQSTDAMPDDFNEVISDFDVSSFPAVAFLAQEMDNTPAIMYDLAKNPLKLAGINSLAQSAPNEARKALKKLSDSIAQNQQAEAEHVETQPPLSRLNPSKKAGADIGKMGLQDFKNADWLRG